MRHHQAIGVGGAESLTTRYMYIGNTDNTTAIPEYWTRIN